MKTTLLVFFLMGASLRAQPVFPTVNPPSSPPDTNREEQLRQAVRRALEGQTNADTTPSAPAVLPALPVPAPATSNTAGPAIPSSSPPATLRPIPSTASPDTAAPPQAPPAAQSPLPGPPSPGRPGAVLDPNAAAPVIPAPGQPALPGTPVPPRALAPGDQASAASTTNAPPEEMIPDRMIDFRGVDLNQVLQVYADLVNRTILRPGTLAAANQIFLTTKGTLTKKEGIQALEAVLAMNGIAIQNIGDKFVKVVQTANAGQVGAPFDTNRVDRLPELGQYVTHVIQVTNVKPSELVQVLTPFASPGTANGIIPIDGSQILVLRDYTENVKRMLEMVKKVDVTIPSEYISEVIPIKYAKASEIAAALNSLSTGGGGTTVGAGGGGAGTRGGAGGRMGAGGIGGGAYGRQGVGGMGGYPGMTPGMGTPYGTQGAVGTQPGAPGATSFSDRLQRIIQKASTSGEIVVLGQTKMIADERTNSLLIYASREDMKTIKDIVSKLDVVLAQVLIEAVIIQVTLNESSQLGVSYLQNPNNLTQIGDAKGIGAINNGVFLDKNAFSVVTNTGGLLSGGFNYLATFDNNSFAATITALANNSKARILQRPRIQTSHNEPAHIFVGESRPYPTSSYYGGGAFGGYSSIQQLPIGVSLDVTPLINPDGLVVMDISQDIESVNGSVTIANVGDVPITSQKTAQTKVSVRDRDTIMLGGLIENTTSKSYSGVPLLMDIPILGYLFRATTESKVRNELIVLIRPTVLPTPEVAALAARTEKDKMPMVKRYETQVQEDENKRQKQSDEDWNKKK